MPETVRTSSRDPIQYLFFFVASSSLVMGLFGVSVLLRMKVREPEQAQIYVSSERDLEAEKAAQRQKIDELLHQTTEPAPKIPAVAAAAPADSRDDRRSSSPRPSRERKTQPDHPKPPQTSGSEPPTSREATIFLPYLADQIASIRIDVRDTSSRVAAAESTIRQLQDSKGWYDWFALCVTLMGIIQGLLGIAITSREWHRAKPSPI